MTDSRVTPFVPRKHPAPDLLDRARSGRGSALGRRHVTIIRVATADGTEEEHRFTSSPRVADLIARLGADVRILGLRLERPDQARNGRPPT